MATDGDCRASGNANPEQILDPAAFTLIGFQLGTIGNEKRGQCRGPGLFQTDLAFYKTVRAFSKAQIQLRFEIFNFFNNTNFLSTGNQHQDGAAVGDARSGADADHGLHSERIVRSGDAHARRAAGAVRDKDLCSSVDRRGRGNPPSRGLGYSLAMRLRLLTVLGAALTSLLAAQDVPRSSPPFPDSQSFLEAQLRPLRPLPPAASRRVRDLLSQMTLKEKVGQMTQLEIGMITDGQEGNLRINPDKLRKAVNDYGVGSILNVKDIALPPAKWHEILGAIARAADQTRLKIPVIYGLDSVHGANYVAGATIFPQALGMALDLGFRPDAGGLGAGGG